MPTHFLNGKLVTEKGLRISPRDLGFTRGYAVFDFLITYHGKPFMLDRHLERLLRSANHIGLTVPWSKTQIHAWIMTTLRANKGKEEKAIYVTLTGGLGRGLLPVGEPTILIMIDKRQKRAPELYEQGVGCSLVKFRRYSPEAKTNNYIEAVKHAQKGRAADQIEPIYYDDDQVYEAARSNVFAVVDGRLLTPKSNVLAGITRDVLLKILKVNIPVKLADFSVGDLRRASEVFITGSDKEVMPVTKLADKKVGNSKVGPITKEAMRQFAEYTKSGKW
jgi:branched-chain amino acid aminotransferase